MGLTDGLLLRWPVGVAEGKLLVAVEGLSVSPGLLGLLERVWLGAIEGLVEEIAEGALLVSLEGLGVSPGLLGLLESIWLETAVGFTDGFAVGAAFKGSSCSGPRVGT